MCLFVAQLIRTQVRSGCIQSNFHLLRFVSLLVAYPVWDPTPIGKAGVIIAFTLGIIEKIKWDNSMQWLAQCLNVVKVK